MPSPTRRTFQVPCSICRAGVGRACTGRQGERLQGVHFQRTTALRAAAVAAVRYLYAPLTPRASQRSQ